MRDDAVRFFSSRLIVITGGTSGIGLALAERLIGYGAQVVVLADKTASVETAVRRFDSKLSGYTCNIGVSESVRAACDTVIDVHGVPDILINNAGYATYRTFEQENSEEIERLMQVNFAGALRVTKAFIGGMVERRSGHIVNMASIAGALPLTPNAVYGASKHGMMAWSKCLALELARFGIDITVICPGRVETRFFDHETFKQRVHRRETELTIPIESVVSASLDAIMRRQAVRYIPHYFRVFAWALKAFGPLVQLPFDRLMRARIDDLYRDARTQ